MMPPQMPDETPCSACVDARCAAETSACASNTACRALISCIVECADGDTVCLDQCVNAFPTGAGVLSELISCVDSECPAECNGDESDAGVAVDDAGTVSDTGDDDAADGGTSP